MMITIPVQLSEELAERVRPLLQDRLPEIIELGLRQWRKQSVLTPRQRVEQLWEAQGLVEPAVSSRDRPQRTRRKRQAPVSVGGQPASEIIIEQRGAL
jgi:hypothetical protein